MDDERNSSKEYPALLLEEIESRLDDAGNGEDGGARHHEHVFTEWCADLLEENGFIGGFEHSPWEFAPPTNGTQMKVSGYHRTDDHGEPRIAIFLSDWSPDEQSPSKASKKRIETLVSVGAAFLERSLFATPPLHKSLEPSHPHAVLADALWTTRDEIREITLHLFLSAVAVESVLDERMLGDIPVKIEIWDARRLMRLHEGRVDRHDEIVVDLGEGLPCIHCPGADDKYDSYLAIIPGEKLARIYDAHGPRLLQENVRAFLQLSVGVNKGIRKTLQEDPQAFFAYNNGLSATASSVETSDGAGVMRLRRISGLQIVNGAQTTGSLHRAWRAGEITLEGVYVPLKVTRVSDVSRVEMVSRISQYANSQTAVKLDDFSANRPFHVRLEELSRRTWTPPRGEQRWYYERTRGQYQDELQRQGTQAAVRKFRQENPSRQKMTKTDVGRCVHAWTGKPHLVALGSQKNFVKFSAEWLQEGWLPDDAWFRELIAQAIVYDSVRTVVRRGDVPAYAANVVAYAVALLAHHYGARIDLRKIWDMQAVPDALANFLQGWARPIYEFLVQSANGRNVTEWCKKSACWDAIQHLKLPNIPPAVAAEVLGEDALGDEGQASAEPGSIARTMIDFSADREKLLRLAQEIVAGRTLKREDALKALQSRLGIARLSEKRREELEGLFADLTHLAFIDDPTTVHINEGLASVRKALRGGVRDHSMMLGEVAKEWLGKVRLGSKVKEQLDDLIKIARKRRIILVDGDNVLCPTPLFETYDDTFLSGALLAVMIRRGRMYPRADVREAVVRSLGFSQVRSEMNERLDSSIEHMIKNGALECPSVGWLRKTRLE